MKPAKTVLLALSLCLILSSCFRIDYTISVDDDGSVEIDQILAVNVAEFSPESFGFEGDSIPRGSRGPFCEGVHDGIADTRPVLPGQEIDEYRSGDFCGARVSMQLDAASDHSSILSQIFDQNTRLVRAGAGWEFETSFSPKRLAADAGFSLDDLAEVLDDAEVVVHVNLPGKAIEGEHNATSVSGGKFTWEIDLKKPETQLIARTAPATGLDAMPVSPKALAVVLGNVALVGGLAWYFVRPEDTPAPAAAEVTASAGSTFGAPAVAKVERGTPYYDSNYEIWMVDDPVRGLLWHREGTGEWVPFE